MSGYRFIDLPSCQRTLLIPLLMKFFLFFFSHWISPIYTYLALSIHHLAMLIESRQCNMAPKGSFIFSLILNCLRILLKRELFFHHEETDSHDRILPVFSFAFWNDILLCCLSSQLQYQSLGNFPNSFCLTRP